MCGFCICQYADHFYRDFGIKKFYAIMETGRKQAVLKAAFDNVGDIFGSNF